MSLSREVCCIICTAYCILVKFRSEWIKDWWSKLDVPRGPDNQETKHFWFFCKSRQRGASASQPASTGQHRPSEARLCLDLQKNQKCFVFWLSGPHRTSNFDHQSLIQSDLNYANDHASIMENIIKKLNIVVYVKRFLSPENDGYTCSTQYVSSDGTLSFYAGCDVDDGCYNSNDYCNDCINLWQDRVCYETYSDYVY